MTLSMPSSMTIIVCWSEIKKNRTVIPTHASYYNKTLPYCIKSCSVKYISNCLNKNSLRLLVQNLNLLEKY